MIVLIDTSTPLCKLTLIDGDELYESEWQADRTLAKGLLSYLQEQLATRGKTLHNITAIGVMKGPGSFTGLRIGLTVMNTIADSENIPIVGVVGDTWQNEACSRIESGENDQVVLPFYGSDPHITVARK